MQSHIKNFHRLPVSILGFGLIMLNGPVTAQTLKTLHSFTPMPSPPYTNNDGGGPYGGLVLSSSTIYGTTSSGGQSGCGTVFALSIDGTSFTNLHNFTPYGYLTNFVYNDVYHTNGDGSSPRCGLILSGRTLYGTAPDGGAGSGTIFKLNTDGTDFGVLYTFSGGRALIRGFTNSDGASPTATMSLSGDALYGTTRMGGQWGQGTVFRLTTNGMGFTNLHSFTAGAANSPGVFTNSDGVSPNELIVSGNTIYGTAESGGLWGGGTVFRLNTDGTGFTNLHNFTWAPPPTFLNGDGAGPHGAVALSGDTLYGTTLEGGSAGYGTVFAVTTGGSGFTNLHSLGTMDGNTPWAGLIVSGDTLYGTAAGGGSGDYGLVFSLNTDGTGFAILYTFGNKWDGGYPIGALMLSSNLFYGTTSGDNISGTVFSLAVTPQLTVTSSGRNVILTWPANFAGFDYTGYTLESTTNLGSSATWASVSPGPVLVSGQFTVTNPISGTQQFFQLSQ